MRLPLILVLFFTNSFFLTSHRDFITRTTTDYDTNLIPYSHKYLVSIEMEVVEETEYSTVSRFSIDDGKVTGFIMEREKGKGNQEWKAGSRKRIPEGNYKVVSNDCVKYYDNWNKKRRKNCGIELRLITQPNKGAGSRDGILIHLGKYAYHSTGCLLIGDAYTTSVGHYRYKRKKKSRKLKKFRAISDRIENSHSKLVEVNDYIRKKAEELELVDINDLEIKILIR